MLNTLSCCRQTTERGSTCWDKRPDTTLITARIASLCAVDLHPQKPCFGMSLPHCWFLAGALPAGCGSPPWGTQGHPLGSSAPIANVEGEAEQHIAGIPSIITSPGLGLSRQTLSLPFPVLLLPAGWWTQRQAALLSPLMRDFKPSPPFPCILICCSCHAPCCFFVPGRAAMFSALAAIQHASPPLVCSHRSCSRSSPVLSQTDAFCGSAPIS